MPESSAKTSNPKTWTSLGGVNLEADELRILHALQCEGSITGVADELGLSQPAVSQRVKRLENRLGVPLTERVGRGIRLTPAGRMLAEHGRKIAREVQTAKEALTEMCCGHSGVLRLVGFPSASATIIPQIMRQLALTHPGLKLEYTEKEPPQAITLFKEGKVDLALVFDYEGGRVNPPAGSTFTPLWREEVKLVLPKDMPCPGETATLINYSEENWIAGCEKCRGHLLEAAGAAGFQPQIVQQTDNVPALLAMVAAGGNVALVPELALAAARTLPEDLRVVPLNPPRHRAIGYVAAQTDTESPQLRLGRQLLDTIDGSQWGLNRHS